MLNFLSASSATLSFGDSLVNWYEQSVIKELLDYFGEKYFSVQLGAYENFSVTPSLGVSLRNIILALALGVIIAVCATAVAVSAEVIDLQTPGAWQKNSAVTAKDGILTVTGKQQLLTAEQITIDPAKTYTFTATMRCVDGKKSAFMPIVLQYDAAKNTIGTGRNG